MSERPTETARGRWRGILPALGVPATFLTGKHQPCPMCGGKDRARFSDKDGRGTYVCSQCGAGDGYHLLMKFNGWDFPTAVRRVDEIVGDVPINLKPAVNPFASRRAMNELWMRSNRIGADDPVDLYLTKRGLSQRPPCLRTVISLSYKDEVSTLHPGMLAMVRAPDGKPSILHRTYLTADGRKAAVGCPRRMMPGTIDKGSAVRLCEPAEEMGIAEGIETAMSAALIHGVKCWAALNEGMLRAWIPPLECKRVVVFGDNDANFVGQAAAFDLAKRLVRDGLSVEVMIPPAIGQDFNDVLMGVA